jgi:adenylate kinase
MKKLVIVLGSPSAGKSSVVSPLKNNKKYIIVNMGDVMLEIAKKRKLATSQDKLRYLTPDQQTDLRDAATEQIAKINGNVILDTHATIEQHGRFFPGLPFYMVEHFKHVAGLFYIDAETDQIMERRKKDKTRQRELEEKWLIDTQRDLNLAIMSYYASDLNIPLYIIDNEDGKLDQTRNTFKKHLEDAFGEG